MTAVEWLREELQYQFGFVFSDNILNKAKEMEKEQIVTAHYQGYRSGIGTTEVSEQYYNETFKSE